MAAVNNTENLSRLIYMIEVGLSEYIQSRGKFIMVDPADNRHDVTLLMGDQSGSTLKPAFQHRSHFRDHDITTKKVCACTDAQQKLMGIRHEITQGAAENIDDVLAKLKNILLLLSESIRNIHTAHQKSHVTFQDATVVSRGIFSVLSKITFFQSNLMKAIKRCEEFVDIFEFSVKQRNGV